MILKKISKKLLKEQEVAATTPAAPKMTAEEFEEMLGASKRYNKYHDDIEKFVKKNREFLQKFGPMVEGNFKGIGQVLLAMQKGGSSVGEQFIKNTLMAVGLSKIVGGK